MRGKKFGCRPYVNQGFTPENVICTKKQKKNIADNLFLHQKLVKHQEARQPDSSLGTGGGGRPYLGELKTKRVNHITWPGHNKGLLLGPGGSTLPAVHRIAGQERGPSFDMNN